MKPLILPNATHEFKAPKNWDNKDGPCETLSVIKEGNIIYSVWKPSWRECWKMLIGHYVQLTIVSDSQPPVSIEVLE